jgi:hypothetical protein
MTVQRNAGIVCLTLLLGTMVPTAVGQTQKRAAISPQRVASAMSEAGWKITPQQIRFLSQVTSTDRDQPLQVVKVTRWHGDKLKAELRCHDRRACLPFYVLVSGTGTADKPDVVLGAGTNADAQGKHPEFEIAAETPLMRSGDPATLTFANKGLSITMPVICLQSGHRGQKIRVASADHKRFYKAEIVGPGLLKAITL